MRNIIYTFFILSLFLFSCGELEQKIDWKTESIPRKLVVEGNITTDLGKHQITLKYSDDYFANQPAETVSNAEITVASTDSVIHYAESDDEPGVYEAESDFAGELNTEYTLTISLEEPVDGISEYSATSKITEGMRIDSVAADLYNNPMINDEEEDSLIIIVVVYGLEPSEYKNYYMVKLYRNGEIISDTITDYNHFSDQDMEINGETAFGMFVYGEYKAGDTLGIELYSIPKDFSLFLDALDQLSQPSDPFGFSGPLANAVGNINDGNGLGFFYAAHVTRGEAIVRDKTE